MYTQVITMVGEIKRWGNSLALRIPKDVQSALDLGEGSQVTLELSRGKLVITPSRAMRSKLLLKALEAFEHDPHGQLEWGDDVGKEKV
jgi:antitoxin MazE